jgi:hypothetical protein
MGTLEENRINLVKKYGVEDEKTKQVSVPKDKTQEFYAELNELMQLEIDIPFEPISLEEFGDISLSAADVVRLDGKIIANDDEEVVEEKKSTVI